MSDFHELYAETLDLQAKFCSKETREVLSSLKSFRDAKEILEVGCGAGAQIGVLTDLIAQKKYDGVDIVPEFISLARKRFSAIPNVRLEVRDILSFVPDHPYDFVLSWAVLQHLSYTGQAMKKFSEFARPGGALAIYDTDSKENEFRSVPDLPTLRELYRSISEEKTGGGRKSHCLDRAKELAPTSKFQVIFEKQSEHTANTQASRDLFCQYITHAADVIKSKYGSSINRIRLNEELENWRSDPHAQITLTDGSWLVMRKT